MARRFNGAEGQSSGTAVSQANSGGLSGDIFDTLTGGGSLVYSNAQHAHGKQSFLINEGSLTAYLIWSGEDSTSAAARMYLYYNSLPTSTQDILAIRNSASGAVKLQATATTGAIKVVNAAGSTVKTFASMSASTWYRLDLYVAKGTGTGDGTIKVAYYLLDNASPVETEYSSVATDAGTTNWTNGRFMKQTGSVALNAHFDDLVFDAGASTYVGPQGNGTKSQALSWAVRQGISTATALPTTGLLLRYRADDISGSNGASITAWPETSGNGHPDAVPPLSANRPTLLTNSLNGHRVVSFNGTSHYLSMSGSALGVGQNKGQVMVCVAYAYPTVATGVRTLFGLSSGTSSTATRQIMYHRDSSGFRGCGGRQLDANTAAFIGGSASTVGQIENLIGVWDYTNSDLYLYQNGVQGASNTNFQAAGSSSNTASLAGTIGANLAGTAEYFNGNIAEIVVYSVSDAATRAAVASYFSTTYGVNTTALLWDVRQGVTKTSALSWAVKQGITKTSAISWDVRQAVTKTQALSWGVRNEITKTLALEWGIRQEALKTQALEWDVRQAILKTQDLEWDLREAGLTTQVLTWDVEATSSGLKTQILEWAVRQGVLKTEELTWPVRQGVTKDTALIWAVRQAVLKTSPLLWDVEPGLAGEPYPGYFASDPIYSAAVCAELYALVGPDSRIHYHPLEVG